MKQPGTLWVVATPVGNLQDVTLRALQVLSEADLVAAEDTRHTRKLMAAHGIANRLTSYHEHNEREKAPRLIGMLRGGKSIALVSDAGTPLISDPGFRLVSMAADAGIACRPVPGACAAIAALSVGALPANSFYFAGFLPARETARKARLEELQRYPVTLAFYESSHRVVGTLQLLTEVYGRDRKVTLCRELTKQFETVMRATAGEVLDRITADPMQRKGEFVLLVGAREQLPAGPEVSESTRALFFALCEELPAGKAARIAAKLSGESRQAIFRLGTT